MSYTELIATVFGIAATILSAMRITYTWLVNMVAVVLFATISYQLKLYSDLILQVYYFSMGVLGWLWWNKKASNHFVQVGYWSPGLKVYLLTVSGILTAAAIVGYCTSNFHIWMPQWFPHQASLPYLSSLVLIMSLVGTYLMGRRYIENWWLWAVSNLISAGIYLSLGSLFIFISYLIFWLIGLSGWYNWQKEYRTAKGKLS